MERRMPDDDAYQDASGIGPVAVHCHACDPSPRMMASEWLVSPTTDQQDGIYGVQDNEIKSESCGIKAHRRRDQVRIYEINRGPQFSTE